MAPIGRDPSRWAQPMASGQTQTISPWRRGGYGARSIRRAADLYAKALEPTIHELEEAGFTTLNAFAAELSRRKVPTARGGKWHPTTVARLLVRLG
jgi:hypothetical protein